MVENIPLVETQKMEVGNAPPATQTINVSPGGEITSIQGGMLSGGTSGNIRSHFGTAAAIGGGIGAMALAKNRMDNMSPDAGILEKGATTMLGLGGLASTAIGINDVVEKTTGQNIGKWTQKILSETKNVAQGLGK